MDKEQQSLIAYYQKELEALRVEGNTFALRFPNIASFLDLGKTPSKDPHIERLLESFAFLTGRLQRQIDDLAPETATALLDALYPSFTRPIPSMALFCCALDFDRCAQNPGALISRGSVLFTTRSDGAVCSFRTSHDLTLWPLQVLNTQIVIPEELSMEASAYLHLRLRWGGPIGQGPERLRFYLTGEAQKQNRLYQALFMQDFPVFYSTESAPQALVPLRTIGLTKEDQLLPFSHQEHRGFRLLEEYFAFPQKFLGADIAAIPAEAWQETISFFLPLTSAAGKSLDVSPSLFGFHCVPGINLFDVVSEPLTWDYTETETLLVPDQRQYASQEIYDIVRVMGVDPKNAKEEEIPPYYAPTFSTQQQAPTLFWTARRKPALRDQGTDVFLSLINTDFHPERSEEKILYAHTVCTNRWAAADIPAGGAFQIEKNLPITALFCMERPTTPKEALGRGEALWSLVSLLSLESLSFVAEEETLARLKDLLWVLSTRIAPARQEIRNITGLSCRSVTRRLGRDGWRGFVPGQEITLEIQESAEETSNPLLLSGVLAEFFRSYTSYNSFVETILHDPQEKRQREWSRQFGYQHDL
ncbi:MAG: type VI secretion system baseplate subunit TssF [Holosporales bacterium]|jgi:type VI secretion system protein ImpG|nr:type VI secretion system baseplate subunit TssF [Holosporales bacterium]